MNVLIGVISSVAAWTMPRRFVDELRGDFPQHSFVDAWHEIAIRQLLPGADVAFTPIIDPQAFRNASRLRWIQVPAAGVEQLLFPELVASPVIITSARGLRARAIA